MRLQCRYYWPLLIAAELWPRIMGKNDVLPDKTSRLLTLKQLDAEAKKWKWTYPECKRRRRSCRREAQWLSQNTHTSYWNPKVHGERDSSSMRASVLAGAQESTGRSGDAERGVELWACAAEPGGGGGGGLGTSRAMRHHRTYTVMCPRGGRRGRTHEQEGKKRNSHTKLTKQIRHGLLCASTALQQSWGDN